MARKKKTKSMARRGRPALDHGKFGRKKTRLSRTLRSLHAHGALYRE
jgi:hypothetical protein